MVAREEHFQAKLAVSAIAVAERFGLYLEADER
jgi:hypothetical protein